MKQTEGLAIRIVKPVAREVPWRRTKQRGSSACARGLARFRVLSSSVVGVYEISRFVHWLYGRCSGWQG